MNQNIVRNCWNVFFRVLFRDSCLTFGSAVNILLVPKNLTFLYSYVIVIYSTCCESEVFRNEFRKKHFPKVAYNVLFHTM